MSKKSAREGMRRRRRSYCWACQLLFPGPGPLCHCDLTGEVRDPFDPACRRRRAWEPYRSKV